MFRVAVIESDRSCIVAASVNPLHIVHTSRSKLTCGTKLQPWLIVAPPGQQISVNLLDFGSKVNTQMTGQQNNCHGYIIDKSAKKNSSICGFSKERVTAVYISHSNVIDLVLNARSGDDDDVTEQTRLLIEFHGIVYLLLYM